MAEIKLGLSRSSGFTTSDNQFFATKLPGLVHQHKLDLRAIVQSDSKHGTKAHLTSTEIADIMERNADAIAKVNSYYKKAINQERKKSGTAA